MVKLCGTATGHSAVTRAGKPKFLKKKFLVFFVFLKVLMYEDRAQNHDPEIHEE